MQGWLYRNEIYWYQYPRFNNKRYLIKIYLEEYKFKATVRCFEDEDDAEKILGIFDTCVEASQALDKFLLQEKSENSNLEPNFSKPELLDFTSEKLWGATELDTLLLYHVNIDEGNGDFTNPPKSLMVAGRNLSVVLEILESHGIDLNKVISIVKDNCSPIYFNKSL